MGLTLRKLKRELIQRVTVLPVGERHDYFTYPIFNDLPNEYKVHANTPLEEKEVRTAICFADDVRRNFIAFYILKKVDWENDVVTCSPLENQSQTNTFWTDAVALIPRAIIPQTIQLKLLRPEVVIEQDRKVRQRRKEILSQPQVQKIEELKGELELARVTGSTDPSRSPQQTAGVESQQFVDPRSKVDGETKEVGSVTGF